MICLTSKCFLSLASLHYVTDDKAIVKYHQTGTESYGVHFIYGPLSWAHFIVLIISPIVYFFFYLIFYVCL